MARPPRLPPASDLWEAAAQAERTGLSWHRTVLSLTALVLLLMRGQANPVTHVVAASGLIAMGALMMMPVHRYRRTASRLGAGTALPGARTLGTLASVVVALGTAAIVAILTSPHS